MEKSKSQRTTFDVGATGLIGSSLPAFQRAKRRAFTEEMLGGIRYPSVDLLPFGYVSEQLKLGQKRARGLLTIPLTHIVGSVGRTEDFTRNFMPRHDSIQKRWEKINQLSDTESLPPIELNQVSRIYFVRDGHHRVSVAKQHEMETIEAEVWEYDCRVPLWPDDSAVDIGVRGEYLAFLERTQLDTLRPNPDIILTERGHYWLIEEEIAIHRYYMGLREKRDPTFQEAMLDWFDRIYQPMIEAIRHDEILTYYPGRTEADVALHVIDHQYRLEERQHFEDVDIIDATEDFAERARRSPWRRLKAWIDHQLLGLPVYDD